MSFSRDVKLEIIDNKSLLKHHKDTLLCGMLLFSQKIGEDEILLKTQMIEIAEFFQQLCVGIIDKNLDIRISADSQNFRLWVPERNARIQILNFLEKNKLLLNQETKIGAFLSGVFLVCGNISDPTKSYHLEFVSPTNDKGEKLMGILKNITPNIHTTIRRNRIVIYSKECRQIQDILTLLGATQSSLMMVEVEMFKTVRNKVNRVTNCETANIDKTVTAATSQTEDILFVLETYGEENLSSNLLETALLRLENPFASLRELTELSPTAISRSGLNHRLMTLSKMAQAIRQEQDQKENENV